MMLSPEVANCVATEAERRRSAGSFYEIAAWAACNSDDSTQSGNTLQTSRAYR
jgi:hypothetical protein